MATPTSALLTVLREPVPVRLWMAGVAMNVVRGLEILAFALYALEATGSPLMVSLVTFVRFLPLLFSALLAALVEAVDRRTVLWALFVLLVAVDATLLAAALTDLLDIRLALIAALASGVAWTFESPLRRTMLAEAAGMDRLSSVMGLEVFTNQLTRAMGPAIGGLLVETIGYAGVFAIGLGLQGIGLLCVLRLPDGLRGPTAGRRGPGLAGLAEGLRLVAGHRVLLATMLVTIVFNLFSFPYVTLAPVIGERILDLSPAAIGLLLATEGMGGMTGAALIVLHARSSWFLPIYAWGAVLFAVGTTTLGVIVWPPLAFATLFVAGLGIAGFNGMQSMVPLLATPAALRVRVMGILTVCIGAGPFGFLLAGTLAEAFGAQNAQLIIGALALASLAAIGRRFPELFRAGPFPAAT